MLTALLIHSFLNKTGYNSDLIIWKLLDKNSYTNKLYYSGWKFTLNNWKRNITQHLKLDDKINTQFPYFYWTYFDYHFFLPKFKISKSSITIVEFFLKLTPFFIDYLL